MRIRDSLYQKLESFENKKVENEQQDRKKAAEKKSAKKDEVSLSPEARELAKTVSVAKDGDGMRTKRVEELKEKIRSGEYQPDSREIAGKMVQDDLDLWL